MSIVLQLMSHNLKIHFNQMSVTYFPQNSISIKIAPVIYKAENVCSSKFGHNFFTQFEKAISMAVLKKLRRLLIHSMFCRLEIQLIKCYLK